MSSTLGVEGNAWPWGSQDPWWPDVQFLLVSGQPAFDYGVLLRGLLGFKDEVSGGWLVHWGSLKKLLNEVFHMETI